MSVALLIRDAGDQDQRILPVATEATFQSKWLPGIMELGLDWGQLMQAGFEITAENCSLVIEELTSLRGWMTSNLGDDAYEISRLDSLLEELGALSFAAGATAFLG